MPSDDPIPPSFRTLRAARTAISAPLRRPPKILHVIPALNAGGARRQLVNLAIGLAKNGNDISILTLDPLEGPGAFYLPELRSHNIPVCDLGAYPDPTRSALNAIPNIATLAAELSVDLKPFTFPIARAMSNDPPDVLHAWLDVANITAALAALILRIPRIILSTRNVNPTRFEAINIPWFQPWYVFLATIPDLIFINNSTAGQHDYAQWMNVPPARFQVIRNGIDTSFHHRASPEKIAAFRNELQLVPGDKLLAGVFRLSEEKRPLLFLQVAQAVMRIHPQLHTAILGHGPLESELRSRIADSPFRSRIHLLPPRADMPVVYSASDVLLQTSILEGTPNTLLEAQSTGCPVVTTPGGGSIECVHDQVTGFIATTPEALADGTSRILHDKDLRTYLSTNGPAFIHNRFNLQRMVDANIGLYAPHAGPEYR